MANQEISSRRQGSAHSLLIGLYHHHIPSIPEKKYSPTPYSELHEFRSQIESEKSGPHHRPYEAFKKQALLYRLAFWGISGLFVILGALLYFQRLNWSCDILFTNCHTLKIVAYVFCTVLTTSSFVIGAMIKPEREAAGDLAKRAHLKLKRMYKRKVAEIGMKNSLTFAKRYKATTALQTALHDYQEKIEHSLEIVFSLFKHIGTAEHAKQTRPQLYNQAILELNDKLHHMIQAFRIKLENFDPEAF